MPSDETMAQAARSKLVERWEAYQTRLQQLETTCDRDAEGMPTDDIRKQCFYDCCREWRWHQCIDQRGEGAMNDVYTAWLICRRRPHQREICGWLH